MWDGDVWRRWSSGGNKMSRYGIWASQVVPVVNNPHADAGDIRDAGSIPRSGRSTGGGHGNPFQYSYLENLMGWGTWWLWFIGSQSQTRLKHSTEQVWNLIPSSPKATFWRSPSSRRGWVAVSVALPASARLRCSPVTAFIFWVGSTVLNVLFLGSLFHFPGLPENVHEKTCQISLQSEVYVLPYLIDNLALIQNSWK